MQFVHIVRAVFAGSAWLPRLGALRARKPRGCYVRITLRVLRKERIPLLQLTVLAPYILALTAAALILNLIRIDSTQAQIPATYGPQLILITVEHGQDMPAQPSLSIHTRLGGNPVQLLASSNFEVSQALRSAGLRVTVLDGHTAGKVYYLVDSHTLSHDLRTTALTFGRLINADGHLLLAVPVLDEREMVESLSSQGASLAVVGRDPLPLWTRLPERASRREHAITNTNPLIENLLPQLSTERLAYSIATLSGDQEAMVGDSSEVIRTRYTFSPNISVAEQYIFETLQDFGLSPYYEPWTYGHYSGRNIVADIAGQENADHLWLIGGHFDTNSEEPYSYAPGADDNGTGVAAALVMADLLQHYDFAETIRFVFFSGEKQGQWGSLDYVRSLSLDGTQVRGYVNLDMIGYDSNEDRVVELHSGEESTHPNSNELATAFIDANTRYGQGLVFERKTDTASRFSDHRSFWDYGYPAFLVMENFFADSIPSDRNPFYHSAGDRLSHLDLDYAARIGRTALATIAERAGIRQKAVTPTPTHTSVTTATVTTATATVSPTTTLQPPVAHSGYLPDVRNEEAPTVKPTPVPTAAQTPSLTQTPDGTPTASPTLLLTPSVTQTATVSHTKSPTATEQPSPRNASPTPAIGR